MSEEQSAGLQDVKETNEIAEQETKQEAKQQSATSAEDVARQGGWKPLEEFDGNQSDWRSAEVFNERGDWIKRAKQQDKRINDLESSFNTRLENTNKLHAAALETQKADLVRKRDEAIDNADRTTANDLQDDIDKLNNQPANEAVPSGDQSKLDTWNKSNSWIDDGSEKADYGKMRFNSHQSQGKSVEESIAAMERDVAKTFPNLNHNRENHPISEGGTKPGRKTAPKKLSMADITSEEKKFRAAMPGAWKTDADFLQAVQDSRVEK